MDDATLTLGYRASVLGGLALGALLLAVGWRRPWPIAGKIGLAVLPAVAMILAWDEAIAMLFRPALVGWSGPRLVPAAAMLRGFPPYTRPGAGPVSGWIYPPSSVLAYLPAAALAIRPGDPVAAILAGRLLSGVLIFGASASILFRGARDARGRVASGLAFGLFAMLAFGSYPLRYVATEVHADGPALALGAMALGALGRFEVEEDPRHRGRIGRWAVVAAVLSVWSKQIAAPWALLAVVRVAVAETRAQGGRGLLRVAGLVAGISLALGLAFGPFAQVFQWLILPSRHPFWMNGWREFGLVLVDVLRQEVRLLALIVGGLIALATCGRRGPEPGPGAAGDRAVAYLVAGAVLAAPLAMLSYAKVGGDVNALAYVMYPLAIAGALAIGRAAARSGLAMALLIAGTSWVALGEFNRSTTDLRDRPASWIAESRMVARHLREHPGEAYFPCHPLEHLAVDGRLFHFEYGVFDRRIAGFPLSGGELLRGIPPRAVRICYPAGRSYAEFEMRQALGARGRRVVPGLPGCDCFELRPVPPLP